MSKTRNLYFIDLFAGAGGASKGINDAVTTSRAVAMVVACINHHPMAIASHAENHICKHYVEDVREMSLTPLKEIVGKIRELDPSALICMWASPDCTGHSRAKGGLAKNADSRSLPNAMIRYIKLLDLDYVFVENVPEFREWGPCDRDGVPIKSQKARDYILWTSRIAALGFKYQYRLLNSADFGAFTSRTRYFGIFAKGDLPITFPEPTHSKGTGDLFKLKPWKKVRDVLDLEELGNSVFFRKKDLVEKTYRRIYDGLVKHVAGGTKRFEEQRDFFIKYYGQSKSVSIDEPCHTLTKKDRMALINCQFMDYQYGTGQAKGLDEPNGTLTKIPKHSLVSVKKDESDPFIMETSFNNKGRSIDEPAPALLASRRHHYLLNPQYNSKGRSIEDPAFTLIARMDKAPPYLVTAEDGLNDIVLNQYKDAGEYKKLVIDFMVMYGIADIKMRMLTIPELLRIQGFGDDYKLKGTITEQKMFIGNSVVPVVSQKITEATINALA